MLKAGLKAGFMSGLKSTNPKAAAAMTGKMSSLGAKRSGMMKGTSEALSKGVLAMAKRPAYTAAGLGAGVGIAALVTSSGRSSDPRAPMGSSQSLYKY